MLSIIFLHWVKDEKGPLKETLLSLQSVIKYTKIPYELILVSNGSTKECNDKIQDIIINAPSEPFVEVKYVNIPENQGVSKGFNAGLKVISDDSKYISIFSNDWYITNNTFENMIEVLDDNPSIGFTTACTNWGAGSMCFDPANPTRFEKPEVDIHAPDFFKINEQFGEHQSKAIAITKNNFPAMGWTMKRQVYDDVGLMDERIFCANDLAYGQRAKLFGWETVTVWNSWIYHEWHSSFSQINNKETYSYLRPKDAADIKLIQTDDYYKIK